VSQRPDNCEYVNAVRDWLEEHGVEQTGQPLPDRFRHLLGAEGCCFENAYRAAAASDDLTYTEGFVEWRFYVERTPGHRRGAHAWLTDNEGEAVEVSPDPPARETVHSERRSFGVPIPLALVRDIRAESGGPVLPKLIA
jgi:hypothetical protein